jgi:hypothetical protein
MPVTASDIVFFPGVRLTEAADGGGPPRYWPLPDGVMHNLFGGVTTLERFNGGLACRKLYPGLANADADGFTNAVAYLAQRPALADTDSVLFAHGLRTTVRAGVSPLGAVDALLHPGGFADVDTLDFQTIIAANAKGRVTLVTGSRTLLEGEALLFYGNPRRGSSLPPGQTIAVAVHGTAYVSAIVSTGTYYGTATTTIDYEVIWESGGGIIRFDTLCSRVEPAPAPPVAARAVGVAVLTAGSAGTVLEVDRVMSRVLPTYNEQTATYVFAPEGAPATAPREWDGLVPIFRRTGQVLVTDGSNSEIATVQRVGFDGKLHLTAALANSYGAGATVHGVIPIGDVQATATGLFSLRTWSRVFADVPVGPTVDDLYTGSIGVSNAGAIEQQWVCVFGLDPTQFDLYGDSLGFVAAGNTSTDLEPINPSTGQPILTLPAAGWQAPEIGNAYRFKTTGAISDSSLWVTRCTETGTLINSPDSATVALRDGGGATTGSVELPWEWSEVAGGGAGTPPPAPLAQSGDLPSATLSPGGAIPALASYRSVHTLAVTLEDTGAPLPVESVTLAIEDGSVCWILSATGHPSLYAQFAEATAPQRVRVSIDGIQWLFIVESATRNRNGTDQHAVTLTGRSAAMAAGEPYAQPRNWINDGAITAAQMAVFAQEGTATSVQWYVLDWLIPDKVLTFAGSPLALVQRIAETIGAQVTCDRVSNAIYVMPRYPRMPTDWAAATPQVTIAEEAIRSDSYQRADKPNYNSVWVSGQQQGVLGQVFLAGTDGAAQAPLVTDLLVTDSPAVLQRGRTILGGSGPQARISMTLPVMTGSGQPGVLSPGQLAEVAGAWRGMVRSVSVSASAREAQVEQTVSIERHFAYPTP